MITMNSVNETGRMAITMNKLVQDNPHRRLYPLAQETIVLLVSEQQSSNSARWSIAATPQWAYSALGTICRERAFLAEQGQILIDGQRLKAEAYLTLWRKATYSPIEWQAAVDAGILITATVSMPSAFIADVVSGAARQERLQNLLQTQAGQAAKTDENTWVWSVPMNHIDNLETFASLCDCYPSPQKYGQGKQISFAVEHRVADADNANAGGDAGQATLVLEAA